MIAKYHKLALTASIAFAMAFIFSCSTDTNDGGNSSNSGGGTSSPSGGNSSGGNSGGTSSSAAAVSGGEDVAKWMTTNLNYETAEGSKCYGNNAENCTKYGRLYNWAAAMGLPQKCNSTFSASDPECKINTPHHRGLCPAGQHIPTKEEWDALITAAGGVSVAGKRLKSDDWNSVTGSGAKDDNCNGTNDYGFAALAGGYGLSDGTFKGLSNKFCNTGDYVARWWSASEGGNASYAHDRLIDRLNSKNVASVEENKGSFLSVRCLQDYLSGGPSSPSTGGSSSSVVTGGSSSSGAAQGGVGSCTLPSGFCLENMPQDRCSRNDGTFSAAACGATYTYCVSGYPDACDLIGSTSMPSKASCPADEDGIKAFANATTCSGAKGACAINLNIGDMQLGYCLDLNRGICDAYGSTSDSATFQAGECGTTAYPCCVLEDMGAVYFGSVFTKEDCYILQGTPANASTCLLVDDLI